MLIWGGVNTVAASIRVNMEHKTEDSFVYTPGHNLQCYCLEKLAHTIMNQLQDKGQSN